MTAETDPKQQLLEAIGMHVPFDGWSETAFRAAVAETGIDPALARAICPRGALDLAVAAHEAGDAEMMRRAAEMELSEMRYRDRVAALVRLRIEIAGDRESVRRATTLFALPQHAAEGGKLIWNTADAIWRALGDSSDDINWYTKRMTLSGVYSATVLYWLGDQSEGDEATWAFLDRRIEGVMQFETLKAKMRDNPLHKAFMAGPGKLLDRIKAPGARRDDLPGRWQGDAR
ncbi:COQ9 family protein [Mesobacterium pallidum]|uniref:COQ9 family protein n=1 Tax=Mesobacterium pallidum TaxID=2872037 RepID=UPI001EE25E3B|nr:COQ9 family protein [Mesobacterium pallidum]